MTETEAKKIGSRQALISVGIGLLTAQLIMTWLSASKGLLKGFFWFTNFSYNLNLIISIIIMLLCAHLYGQRAGKSIITQHTNSVITGIKCGMAVLITTAFLSSFTGFFQEGISKIGTDDNPFIDYLFKPFFWIFFFGLVPVLLVGVWSGTQIKKQASN